MKTEQVIADAQIAAVYLRSLIASGVPMTAAVPRTSSYVMSCRMSDSTKEPPREPWQDDGR